MRRPIIGFVGVVSILAVVACGTPRDIGPIGDVPDEVADEVAAYAVATYGDAAIETLAELVGFRTVHRQGVANPDNPQFRAMTAYLDRTATSLGLDFEDHGAVVVIGLGEAERRLGIVTHGDVQPADPGKWARDPFELDRTSEPGRLVGRGTEDDKGPIAAAIYAMKALADRGPAPTRRVELIISYTEESDWVPFQRFLAEHPPPELNVVLDAEYPVVTAENGFGLVRLSLQPADDIDGQSAGPPRLASFTGGAFVSQIPEDARAVIADPTSALRDRLTEAAGRFPEIEFRFVDEGGELLIEARGEAAHSSKPWDGRNAITHLAALLGDVEWPDGQAARMVHLVNDLVGTGDYAERFGELAYTHPFMGRLTLSLTTLGMDGEDLVASINFRAPAGRGDDETERIVDDAVSSWSQDTGIEVGLETEIYTPYFPEEPAHVPVLLDVFRRHTGDVDAGPIAIGGGTHARLLPGGVDFGPAMPGTPYTGHSEHEYLELDQFLLNLRMYTAMLVELTGGD